VGFSRTELAPGEAARLHVRVPAGALQTWDPARDTWTTPAGRYRLSVGTSARTRPLSGSFLR